MKAVVLAAGEGVRMRPLSYTRPKVMLPVANKPILEHLLLEARKAGIEEFILVVGYHGETIRDYFGDGRGWGVSIDYATQRKQLGTADALRWVAGWVEGRFLVLNGDVLVRGGDIARLLAREGVTLGVIEVEETEDLGVVKVEGDRVVGIYEKVKPAPSKLANVGLYLLTSEVLAATARIRKSPRGEYELTDCLQLMIEEGYPVYWEGLDYWLNLSYPWDLLGANESLVAEMEPQNLGVVEEGAVIKGPVAIGEGTLIRANSYIVGPAVIGRDCDIGPNCYIRPATAIGDNCRLGSAVEVKNSIIMRDNKIPHHNYVGDSIIGEGCDLGAGTKIANLRFDEKEVQVGDIDTGRRKLGAILGDGVRTGINASINVGSLIGPHSYIGPGALASGWLLPDSRVF